MRGREGRLDDLVLILVVAVMILKLTTFTLETYRLWLFRRGRDGLQAVRWMSWLQSISVLVMAGWFIRFWVDHGDYYSDPFALPVWIVKAAAAGVYTYLYFYIIYHYDRGEGHGIYRHHRTRQR